MQIETTRITKLSKKKLGMIILLIVLIGGAGFFQVVSAKVRQAAEETLLSMTNEKVNGKVEVGSMDLSMLGAVEANKVKVLNSKGQVVVAVDQVKINYNWSDLLKGQLGPQLITGISIDKPEVWLLYKDGAFNMEGLIKPQNNNKANFTGTMKVQNGTVNYEVLSFKNKIEQLNGIIDLSQENVVRTSGNGKVQKSSINIDGQWTESDASIISLKVNDLDMTQLGISVSDSMQLTAGMLDEVTVKIGKDASGNIALQTVDGRFSGIETKGALEIQKAGASFTKQGDSFVFTDINALYKGQAVTGTGQVINGTEGQTLDFAVNMPMADPTAILPSLKTSGSLAASMNITGAVLSPVVTGNFTLGGLDVDGMAVSGISGSFKYMDKVLELINGNGLTNGGQVFANGLIYPDTEKFNLSISGNELNSSQMTDKDVSGPLSFSGMATGDATSSVIQGSFSVYDGKAYGLSFQVLNGNFVKYASGKPQISNLAIKTAFGTFYPEELNQNIMSQLNGTIDKTNISNAINDAKKAGTEKLLQQIFH